MGAQNEWVKETEARLDRLRSLIEATHREDADSALTAAAQAGAPTPASAAPASAALPVPATAPAAPAAPITAPAEVPLQDNGSTVL
jgi:hypothetical protein